MWKNFFYTAFWFFLSSFVFTPNLVAKEQDYSKNLDGKIHPISRELGSGTRAAFSELFKITKKVNGKKVDDISAHIEVTNATAVAMGSVMRDVRSIGYISLGSLNPNLKAIGINGIKPSVENIKNKTYPIMRDFYVVYKKDANPILRDLLRFIASKQGVKIIQKMGYVPLSDEAEDYHSKDLSGKLSIAGSSSISPLMEVFISEYMELNKKVKIILMQSDSTTGLSSVQNGLCDLGMVSREVSSSELKEGFVASSIAKDAIVIVVNPKNPIETLSTDQIKKIYTYAITHWEDLK